MFGRKKNKKVKVEIQTNLGEFKELIREAESLLDQLQDQTNLYKRYHRKLKSLSAKNTVFRKHALRSGRIPRCSAAFRSAAATLFMTAV